MNNYLYQHHFPLSGAYFLSVSNGIINDSHNKFDMDVYLHSIINSNNENKNHRWYILEEPLYEVSEENVKSRYVDWVGICIAIFCISLLL